MTLVPGPNIPIWSASDSSSEEGREGRREGDTDGSRDTTEANGQQSEKQQGTCQTTTRNSRIKYARDKDQKHQHPQPHRATLHSIPKTTQLLNYNCFKKKKKHRRDCQQQLTVRANRQVPHRAPVAPVVHAPKARRPPTPLEPGGRSATVPPASSPPPPASATPTARRVLMTAVSRHGGWNGRRHRGT